MRTAKGNVEKFKLVRVEVVSRAEKTEVKVAQLKKELHEIVVKWLL